MSGSRPETPHWLQDVSLAAQHLTRLSLESAAQAALIVKDGKLWAYAGELPQPAGEELSLMISSHWASSDGGDLARFVTLGTAQADYMLYATQLAGDMVLALVFDAATPFSKMRSQASQLARALASPPAAKEAPPTTPPPAEVNKSTPLQPESRKQETTSLKGSPKAMPVYPPADDSEDYDGNGEDAFPLPVNLPPLFEDVPPPTIARPPAGAAPPAPVSAAPPLEDEPPLPDAEPLLSRDVIAKEWSLENQQADEQDTKVHDASPLLEPRPEGVSLRAFLKQPAKLEPRREPAAAQPAAPEPAESQAKTQPVVVGEAPQISYAPEPGIQPGLQPVSPAVCNLTLASVLTPRMPRHHLIGDLPVRLSTWMSELCLAFGWRLEYLSIRPDYLSWVTSITPATSPLNLIRIIRTNTSRRIFEEFPKLAKDNPSGDFWAPGYLITSSSTPPDPQMVKTFIQQTRQHQGVDKTAIKDIL